MHSHQTARMGAGITIEDIPRPASAQRLGVSIEFAHIYAHEIAGGAHRRAAAMAADVRADWVERGAVSLDVLVDDYNTNRQSLDLDEFADDLAAHGARPDRIFRESCLVPQAHFVLQRTARKESRSYLRYFDKRDVMPCAPLVAAWYLMRLGLLPSAEAPGHRLRPARNLVNILEKRFESSERSTHAIIGNGPWSESLHRISTIYL